MKIVDVDVLVMLFRGGTDQKRMVVHVLHVFVSV